MITVEKNRCIPALGSKTIDLIPSPVFEAGRDNFRDNSGDSQVPYKSKLAVYLAFSRGEVAERPKAAVC